MNDLRRPPNPPGPAGRGLPLLGSGGHGDAPPIFDEARPFLPGLAPTDETAPANSLEAAADLLGGRSYGSPRAGAGRTLNP